MPLHGKIVVIKKSGVDGVEFPLTASCLFGRKPDSDIRIQIPQVSKEHCRIDLNENKEVILTNLSKANPTRVNGEVLTQSERLKHGDTITIVDRSFRFEYPPAPTPKKRSSTGGKTETLKVRQDQQVAAAACVGTGEKRTSEVTAGTHLKDGAHHNNIQQSLEKTLEMESTEASQVQSKNNSPFSDLYHMIKKSLEIKTPCKPSASQAQTPTSKFCTPKPASVRKSTNKPATPIPKNDQPKGSSTPQTAKKQAKNFQGPVGDTIEQTMEEPNARSEGPSPKRRSSVTPQKFTALEIIEQIADQTLKSPTGRRSKEVTSTRAEADKHQDHRDMKSPKAKSPGRASPGNLRTTDTVKEAPKKRKSGELRKDQPTPPKKKRVSFGGQLSPELFDKRLPPNSPLRKGATPRRSLIVFKPKSTLLRRASVISLIKEQSPAKARTPSPKKLKARKSSSPKAGSPARKSPKSGSASPKTPSPARKSPKSGTAISKTPSSAQKSPKSGSATPKTPSPVRKSPKSGSASPKTPSPAQKSPKSGSAISKTPSSAQKSPKSGSAISKTPSSAQKSPKSGSAISKTPSSAQMSPKSGSATPKTPSPARKSPKSGSASPKTPSSAQMSPKSGSATPKTPSPARKSPKSGSASPKTPSSAQMSPKSRSATPKTPSPAQKSPKSGSAISKTPSPARKSPKSGSATPKTSSPAQTSLKSGSSTPKAKRLSDTSPKTPLNSVAQTPRVQGRFSVSRISTPSPIAEAEPDQEPSVTPKIPIKRKSMKSSARKTPRAARSAAKMLQRRSGASRISMKALTSWAGIVKFGKTKSQVNVPSKKQIPQKIKKKAVKCKPQTPARVPKGHVSTGHADSPATIVVGRAHKKAVAVGAVPRVIINDVLLKKNMKMDEDLTGISEMFKTPGAEKKKQSLTDDTEIIKTPGSSLSASVMESVLSTPEESGEMIVSPLSVASTIKSRQYNSEAVQRLLDGEESSFVSGDLTVSSHCVKSRNQSTDVKTAAVMTPKQKAPKLEGLTGVKRIMKTPKQKREPLEDLQGKILKTPKQKLEQPECLTGVKRIMKTPKHKAEPLEDLRGKILKTPKQKAVQQECLTGVKRIMKTPKHKAEPLEDLRGKLLKTPKQKQEQQECLTGVKRIFKTPKQKAEPVEDFRGKLIKTPKVKEMLDATLDGVEELLKTPTNDKAKNTPTLSARCSAAKKTPGKTSYPVQDLVGVKRLMRTPKEKGEAVEENFGIKRLMKSPRLRGNPPVEDFEGLQELMEEPLTNLTTDKQDKGSVEYAALTTTEPDGVEDKNHSQMLNESSNNKPSEAADSLPLVDADVPQQPEADNIDEINADKVPEVDSSEKSKKSNQGRHAKAMESEEVENKNVMFEPPEEPAPILPAKGRRGKKTEATASSAVRSTRGRNAKTSEEENTPQVSKAANKRELERNAKWGQKGLEVTEDFMIVENKELEHQETSEMTSKPSRTKRAKAVQNEAPVRAKRGRNPKCEDEEVNKVPQNINDSQQAVVEEMTNKSEEIVASEQEEPALVEAEPSKPRRGGRKVKQDPESVAPAASIELQEMLSVSTEKTVRGRRGKLVMEDAVTKNQELEPEHQKTEEGVSRTIALQNEAPVRAKRGRNTKHEDEEINNASLDVTGSQQASVEEMTSKSEKIVAPDLEEPALVAAEPSKPRRGGRKAKQDAESVAPAASNELQEVVGDSTNKPVRGRRGKPLTEDVIPAENQDLELKSEHLKTAEKVSRTKRVKAVQNEAPARVQRGRNAKHEDEEVNKVSLDVTESQQASVEEMTDESENIVTSDLEEPAVEALTTKPRRGGRKAKQEAESVAPAASTVLQEVISDATEKPVRGRKGKPVREDAVIAENQELEPNHQQTNEKVCKPSRAKAAKYVAPVRAKRGRNAKHENEEVDKVSQNITDSQPAVMEEKSNKSEKTVAPDQDKPAAEPSKPRRGGRKAKQDAENVAPAAELQEMLSVSTEKPVRGRRGKLVMEDAVTAENQELQPEHQETDENVSKPSRAKRAAKNEVQKAAPAKRTRRGAAPAVETAEEHALCLPELAPVMAEPKAKRGRQVAGKQRPEEVSSEQTSPAVEESKKPMRSVKWKANVEICDIPKAVKAVRGRKTKLDTHDENKNVFNVANTAKEEELSGVVVQTVPAKRSRRGVQGPDVTVASTSNNGLKENESQPKTRRGRAAKK